MTISTRKIGAAAEQFACDHLQQQGLTLVNKNYLCKMGEIDLIMLDHDILVFVEVRYRKNAAYLDAIETIDHYKQQKILRTSLNFLQRYPRFQQNDVRFDVVIVNKDAYPKQLEWVQNAFSA